MLIGQSACKTLNLYRLLTLAGPFISVSSVLQLLLSSIDRKVRHEEINIGHDAKGADDKGNKDQSTDKAHSDSILPIKGCIIRLGNSDCQS